MSDYFAERALAAAVIADAIKIVTSQRDKEPGDTRFDYYPNFYPDWMWDDAWAWLHSDDIRNGYSFVNLCGFLSLDVGAIRARLAKYDRD
jgi:hypothetical protein